MNIHQLSVHHDERQDRLLLRINTLDQKEFRFWLTRRLTMRLLPVVQQTAARLEAAQPGVAVTDTRSQNMLGELRRESFLQRADFATPFVNPAGPLPLGSEPMLITEVRLSILSGGNLEVIFEEQTDPSHVRSCQLRLPIDLVHGLVHLMEQAVDKAQWGAAGSLSPAVEPGTVATQEPPHYTH